MRQPGNLGKVRESAHPGASGASGPCAAAATAIAKNVTLRKHRKPKRRKFKIRIHLQYRRNASEPAAPEASGLASASLSLKCLLSRVNPAPRGSLLFGAFQCDDG